MMVFNNGYAVTIISCDETLTVTDNHYALALEASDETDVLNNAHQHDMIVLTYSPLHSAVQPSINTPTHSESFYYYFSSAFEVTIAI